jgi:hypothetical protein
MREGTYVYLLWENPNTNAVSTLHGVYANREDAERDAKYMQAELDAAYLIPSKMWVAAWVVDTKPVA